MSRPDGQSIRRKPDNVPLISSNESETDLVLASKLECLGVVFYKLILSINLFFSCQGKLILASIAEVIS